MATPAWLDTDNYPFLPHYFTVPAGRMHYVDEGRGDPIVFVHGNPAWSFEFRHLITAFSATHRCIAPDHIGFGLSDKPKDWSYLPEAHAGNFTRFAEALDLRSITLVVGDWGGPIGLSYAIGQPEKIRNIVILNTWLWPVQSDWYYQAFSRIMGGPVGRWLIVNRNFFAGTLMKSLFGDKRRLTPAVHRQYLMALASPEDRRGCAVLPGQITGSSAWLQSLWDRRERLEGKNILILWGMKDIAFRKKELARWIAAFPGARVVRFGDAGHFVPEEKPVETVREMRDFFSVHPVS